MATLLEDFCTEMAQARNPMGFSKQQSEVFLISQYKAGHLGIAQLQFELGLYPFFMFPRTECYEVARNIPLPEISKAEFDKTVQYYDFCRPWVLQFTDNTGLEKIIIHSNGFKGFLDFTEVTRLPNGTFSYSVLRFDAGTIKVATNLGNQNNLLRTFYWIVRLFHAKHIKDYFDVLGGNTKRKPRGISGVGTVTCKIFLSAKGKKYHYAHQQTQNPNYKNGKKEVEVEVSPFRRRVRYGKGRINEHWVDIDSFHRKQWVLPRDKVTKIAV